jgi:hypothetical protein
MPILSSRFPRAAAKRRDALPSRSGFAETISIYMGGYYPIAAD